MSETKTAAVVTGPPAYSLAKGLQKALIQVATVAGAAALTALVAMLEDPTFQAKVLAIAKDKAWAPILALALQGLVVVGLNWRKTRGGTAQIEAATVEASPAAAASKVQAGIDAGEAPAPAVVLTKGEAD